MAEQLKRIVYRSDTIISHEDHEALRKIFRISAYKNRRDDITGALPLPDGQFVQVIEGRQKAINGLMSCLSADNRHSNIVVLGNWPITVRLFSDWAMARPDTTPIDQQMFRIMAQAGAGAQVVGLLLNLVQNQDVPMF